ncbi:MAG: rhomboid family intramembrane serine protease [Myxococcota bacterium]
MIPFRDDVPSARLPIANYALILTCAATFYLEITAGVGREAWILRHALVPERFFALGERLGYVHPQLYAPLISSIFLHGGVLHLLGNMLFLWIFGDNVEDRFGSLGYAAFFLAGGVVAGLTHTLLHPASQIPTVGASGAIAAVMGAYLLMYPRARVETLVIIVIFVRIVRIPAALYLPAWFGIQLLHGIGERGALGAGSGVAWWAHAGGFVFGTAAVLLLGRQPRRTRVR